MFHLATRGGCFSLDDKYAPRICAPSGKSGHGISMKFFRRPLRNQEGITAIEFAFVGPPFLLLLAAIFEVGLTLTTQSLLDGAARDAARLIRTGQAQSQGSPITAFQSLLCSEVSSLISASDCATKIVFEVQVFS